MEETLLKGLVDEPHTALEDENHLERVKDLRGKTLAYPKLDLKLGDSINMHIGYQKSTERSNGLFDVSTLVSTPLSLKLIESAYSKTL
jgi:hypothetical protein